MALLRSISYLWQMKMLIQLVIIIVPLSYWYALQNQDLMLSRLCLTDWGCATLGTLPRLSSLQPQTAFEAIREPVPGLRLAYATGPVLDIEPSTKSRPQSSTLRFPSARPPTPSLLHVQTYGNSAINLNHHSLLLLILPHSQQSLIYQRARSRGHGNP